MSKSTKITATRYHDFSAGHRVVGHENKCRHLHGHNYRVHFHVSGGLDDLGRVMDFGVIKSKLCAWLENSWDHKMILSEEDPYIIIFDGTDVWKDLVLVPFNPTAENMAKYLLEHVGPILLRGTHVTLVKVDIEETRKCSASAELS